MGNVCAVYTAFRHRSVYSVDLGFAQRGADEPEAYWRDRRPGRGRPRRHGLRVPLSR